MFTKSSFLLLMVSVAISSADPSHVRLQQRRPFFARQESVPTAPQPEFASYPSADELKPDNPFVAEEEAVEPELVYGPPDSTYGPPLPAVDALPAVEGPLEFASDPDAEEFANFRQRPARLQQRPKQQSAQLHLVQRTQRLQQRKQQQKAVIKQIVNVPAQKATIRQVVHTQRLVAQPSPAAAVIVAAPIAAARPPIAPTKVVINSERLVAAEPAPHFSASIGTPFGESFVVIDSPFALNSQLQVW